MILIVLLILKRFKKNKKQLHLWIGLWQEWSCLFISSNSVISPYLVYILNKIHDSGLHPEVCKGIIVPIHKKGNVTNLSNYRGITLVNVIGNIFCLLLRNRLNKWCEQNHVFNESQFGFRDNHSTTDCIFIHSKSVDY
jgi:hypothetical protein